MLGDIEPLYEQNDVLLLVNEAFEKQCLFLVTEAYKRMREERNYDLDYKETQFSALLIRHMRAVRDTRKIRLRIYPEQNLYTDAILSGTQDPDTSARIDIFVSGAWTREDAYYGIEAKILVEVDWETRKRNYLNKRYIETGIDNYVNGRYSTKMQIGCIIGYIVHGDPRRVAANINGMLGSMCRASEQLQSQMGFNGYPFCYSSQHQRSGTGGIFRIQHVMLSLT